MTDETVSVICFFCYGKLLFCNVRNAPRGCALRRTRQMSQAIYVSLRPLLNKRHWRENVPRACLKNHFRNVPWQGTKLSKRVLFHLQESTF